ncbi:hypothetical protein KC573_01570, partial [candidate division WWE3 bacterium]|nr:hypothetical protein [candidate division WWE3 bacterium]
MLILKRIKNITLTKEFFLVFVYTIIGALFRLYHLDWGAYYFHPDEHNIVYGISQMKFPETMHPDFFVYGTFPAYVIYFASIILEVVTTGITDWHIDPQQSIIL